MGAPASAISLPLEPRPVVAWSDTSVAVSDVDDPYGLYVGGETNGGKCIPLINAKWNWLRLGFLVAGTGTVGTFPTVRVWGANPLNASQQNMKPFTAPYQYNTGFTTNFLDATFVRDATTDNRLRFWIPCRELIGSAFTNTWSSTPDVDKDDTTGSQQIRLWHTNVIYNVQGMEELLVVQTVAQTFSAGSGAGCIIAWGGNDLRT